MKERHINRRIIVAIMFLVLSGIGIILYRNEKTWKPDGLKVELMENPVGIDTLSPAFSWKVNGKEEGVYQKAYQIVVAATRKKLSEGEYLIDSGWCESGENTYVKLENAEKILNNNQIYYWKVRIKDGKDNYSHFSEVNTFSTGVGAEWQETNGIWSADEATYIFLRNKFELKSSDIERAILSIIALSPEDTRQYVYSVYLNEKYVGSGPAQMAGNKYYYNSFDVTKEISRKNVLGAVCYSNKEQGFLCQLTVYYTNGAKETVVNSSRDIAQWKCMNGNAAYGLNENMTGTGYYLGNAENIDAEYYPMGWLKENYDTASWETPVYTWTLKEQELSPYQTENMQKYYSSPAEVKEIEKGHYFIDLGKEIIGGIAVKIPHYAQHATAYALYAKIYNTDIMKDNMVAYLKSQGEIRMSVFGSYFLLQGLYDNDAGDYAMKLLTEANPEKEHTWAYMLNTDKATITTEAWSTKIKDNMTFSHPWGASPAAFIVQGMFGIEPKEAGFTEFDVKLQPGQVKEASVKVPVIKGDIEVSYLLDQNNLLEKIVIKIPSNTIANVKIPEAYIKGKDLYMKKSRLEM